MEFNAVIELVLFVVLLTVLAPPLGSFLYKVYEGQKTFLHPLFGPLEKLTYRFCGVNENQSMDWKSYAFALIWFQILGIFGLFLIQMVQGGITWHSALNTAVSFVTNTNWQGYAGEVSMSNWTQTIGLTVQNFVSAATGMAVAVVLMRGVSRRGTSDLGNFWADLVRGIYFVLLPLSVVFALFLVSQGVVQTLATGVEALTLEGGKQSIPLGPVASQVAIKMLGTNGGGSFNANAAHPFENPTALSNFIQMLSISILGAALVFTYGRMTLNRRHSWLIYGVMMTLFVTLTTVSLASEFSYGLMEGKEARFGVMESVLFSTITTSASCGAVNSMHSTLSPLSGGVAMLNMMLGEIIIGGVGAGFYGMMLFVILTVFIAGLMVGRTPEYMGKKIEAREMGFIIIAILSPCAMILLGTAISLMTEAGTSSLSSQGPHGLSEALYAFTSAAANNGSAFAGLSANTVFYNLMLALAMLIGRFAIIVPILAVAGSLAHKKYSPPSSGTFETDSGIFAVLLIGVILIVGALTFFPALSLGPIVEHLMMMKGQSYGF